MRVYPASAAFLVFLYSLLTFLTLGGLAVFVLGVTGTPVNPAVWLLPVGLVILAGAWVVYLKIPFTIYFQEDHTLEFKSFVRVVTLSPQDIVAIRGRSWFPGFLQVTHAKGKLVLTTQMRGMQELIALIKEENPAVQVTGY